jgi:hypothetical protein
MRAIAELESQNSIGINQRLDKNRSVLALDFLEIPAI